MSVLALARRALVLPWLCISLCNAWAASSDAKAPKRTSDVKQPQASAIWLLHPSVSTQLATLAAGDEREALFQGIRLRRQANGATQRSSDFISGSATTALRVPDAWGGGFVFHSDIEAETSLWYGQSWLGPLQPLGRFAERADRVTLGFGRIYVHLGDSGETVALNLHDGQVGSLGPLPNAPGYFDLRFWDDWFAVANTDVRGVLVTFDAGATWHPTGITDETATFSVEDEGIGIRTRGEYLVLQPDGVWQSDNEDDGASALPKAVEALIASSDGNQSTATRSGLGQDAIRQAVLHGWPATSRSAFVATAGSVGLVNLVDGRVERIRTSQYAGYESCHATALGQEIAMICPLVPNAVGIFRLRKDLSLELLARFEHPVSISSGGGALLAHAPCPDNPSGNSGQHTAAACLVDASGARPVPIPVSTDGPELWVPLSANTLAVVQPPRPNAPGSMRVIRIGSPTQSNERSTSLRFAARTDAKTRTLVETGFWLTAPGVLSDGRLGFWVAHSNRLVGVIMATDGTLSVARRTDTDLRRTHVSGPRAIELTSGEIAYASTDYGQTWTEFQVPRGLTSASTRNTTEEVGCSAVGCAFGAWLRVGYGAATADTSPNSQPRGENANPEARLVQVPLEAALPAAINLHPTAYSQWQLTCYPSGTFEDASKGSAAATFAAGQAGPRSGSQLGFGRPVTAPNANELDLAPSAHRNFLGVKHPELPAGSLAFDMGDDGEYQFRAYTFGSSEKAWASNSTWLVRVADRFAVSGLWSTAPTRAPWPDMLSAAQLFGADRANRHSSSWQLTLDPSERAGVLRVNTSGTTELHFIEANTSTTSIGGQSLGSVMGAVKVNGTWYFGTQDGNHFSLYHLRQGAPVLIQSYPVSDFVHVTLIRNDQASRIALLLRAPAGTWHIYPLTDTFESEQPLLLDRDTLNQQWPKCAPDSQGWVVTSALPLSRFTPGVSSDILSFADDGEMKAEAVVARALVNPSEPCVEALAARLTSAHAPTPERKKLPNLPNTIPLTLTDRVNDVRHGFQCGE